MFKISKSFIYQQWKTTNLPPCEEFKWLSISHQIYKRTKSFPKDHAQFLRVSMLYLVFPKQVIVQRRNFCCRQWQGHHRLSSAILPNILYHIWGTGNRIDMRLSYLVLVETWLTSKYGTIDNYLLFFFCFSGSWRANPHQKALVGWRSPNR